MSSANGTTRDARRKMSTYHGSKILTCTNAHNVVHVGTPSHTAKSSKCYTNPASILISALVRHSSWNDVPSSLTGKLHLDTPLVTLLELYLNQYEYN